MGRIYPRSIIFVDSQVKKDSKLVKCIKLWPIIFDKTNPLHFNRKEREKIWKIIAKNLESTAQICEERWRTLLDAYEKCKNGYLTMHEILLDQLEECLNIVYKDINQNTQETHIYKSSKIFSEINEEIQSISFNSSEQYGPSFPESTKRKDLDIREETSILPVSEIRLNFTEKQINCSFWEIGRTLQTEMMQETVLDNRENSEPPVNIEFPISGEQHSCLFFENDERSM